MMAGTIPTISFDYEGKHYMIPWKEGARAGIVIRDSNLEITGGVTLGNFGPNALYGGYKDVEIKDMITKDPLKYRVDYLSE